MRDFFNDRHRHNSFLELRFHKKDGVCLVLADTFQVAALLDYEQQLLLSWLSREEQGYLQRFRFAKRRNEWLSGRIAAKCCLLQASDSQASGHRPEAFSILPDTHGRPVLSDRPATVPKHLSISHSRRYAVAMSTDTACGIDIQYIGDQILKVKNRIASDKEIALVRNLRPGDRETGLTLLWTVKEAVKKHRLPEQPGIFEAITVEQVDPGNRENSWVAGCRLNGAGDGQIVHVVRLDDYMLAWSHEASCLNSLKSK